jgi:hypothetical protein
VQDKELKLKLNLKEVSTLCGRPEYSYSIQIFCAYRKFFAFAHALRRKSRLVREMLSPSSFIEWRSFIPRSKFVGSISHTRPKTLKNIQANKQVTADLQKKRKGVDGLWRNIYTPLRKQFERNLHD